MIFGMFKKTVDDTIGEVVKTPLAKDVLSQISDTVQFTRNINNSMIDMMRLVSAIHRAETERKKTIEILHFLTTLILLGVVLFKM